MQMSHMHISRVNSLWIFDFTCIIFLHREITHTQILPAHLFFHCCSVSDKLQSTVMEGWVWTELSVMWNYPQRDGKHKTLK